MASRPAEASPIDLGALSDWDPAALSDVLSTQAGAAS